MDALQPFQISYPVGLLLTNYNCDFFVRQHHMSYGFLDKVNDFLEFQVMHLVGREDA